MFSYICGMSSGFRPYDVTNDITNSAILEISNDDIISGTGRRIDFVFDSSCHSIVSNELSKPRRYHL